MQVSDSRLVGWVICRLRDQSQSHLHVLAPPGVSLTSQVYDLAYGTISDLDFPPIASNAWVFLAQNTQNSIVAQHFDENDRRLAAIQSISLTRMRVRNEAFEFLHDPLAFVNGFLVENSPIQELNGTYLENGMHDGVPMYINVRHWCIVRCPLQELPELGISAADNYRQQQEGGNLSFFLEKAGENNRTIILT